VSASGSKFHERVAHFFIDVYTVYLDMILSLFLLFYHVLFFSVLFIVADSNSI